MNRYYPLKWVRDKIGDEKFNKLKITPGNKKSWNYSFYDESGEHLIVETNAHHKITSVIYTPLYRSVGLSLKRAKTQGTKACRYMRESSGLDKKL